ncbi:hypothetical protein BC830DRAFT_678826 [Chytriomyces sp. MP71]|nr:hypothetical protein BC830DRAFT_678826 [Chytriomyces sp. MP71]
MSSDEQDDLNTETAFELQGNNAQTEYDQVEREDELKDFDVEAQIALELQLLPPESLLNEDNFDREMVSAVGEEALVPSFEVEEHFLLLHVDSDLTRHVKISREERLTPEISIMQEAYFSPQQAQGTLVAVGSSLMLADALDASLLGSVSGDSFVPAKSWTDLIAVIRAEEANLEHQKMEIEREVDAALGFTLHDASEVEEKTEGELGRRFSLYRSTAAPVVDDGNGNVLVPVNESVEEVALDNNVDSRLDVVRLLNWHFSV